MSCRTDCVLHRPARFFQYLAFTNCILIYITLHATHFANGEEVGGLGMCTRLDDMRQQGVLRSPLTSDGLDTASVVCSCALSTAVKSVLHVDIEESSCAAGDNLVLSSGSQTIHLCSASTFKPKQVHTSHSHLQLLWTGRTDGRSRVHLTYEAQPTAPIRIHCQEGKLSQAEYNKLLATTAVDNKPMDDGSNTPGEDGSNTALDQSYTSLQPSHGVDSGLSLASLRYTGQHSALAAVMGDMVQSLADGKQQGEVADALSTLHNLQARGVSNSTNQLPDIGDYKGLELGRIKQLAQKQAADKQDGFRESTLDQSIPLDKLLSLHGDTDKATDTKLSYEDIKQLLKGTPPVTGAGDLLLDNTLLSAVEHTLQNETDSHDSASLSVDNKDENVLTDKTVNEPASVSVDGDVREPDSVSVDGDVREPDSVSADRADEETVAAPTENSMEEAGSSIIEHGAPTKHDTSDIAADLFSEAESDNELMSTMEHEQQSTRHTDSQPSSDMDFNLDSDPAADTLTPESTSTKTAGVSTTTEGTRTGDSKGTTESTRTTTTETSTVPTERTSITSSSITSPIPAESTPPSEAADGDIPESFLNDPSSVHRNALDKHNITDYDGREADTTSVVKSASDEDTTTSPSSIVQSSTDSDFSGSAQSTNVSSSPLPSSTDSGLPEKTLTSLPSSTPWWSKFKQDVYINSHSSVPQKKLVAKNSTNEYTTTIAITNKEQSTQLTEVNVKKNQTEHSNAAVGRIVRPVSNKSTSKMKKENSEKSVGKMESTKILSKTGKQLGKSIAQIVPKQEARADGSHGVHGHVTIKKIGATTDKSDRRQASRVQVTTGVPSARVTDHHVAHTSQPTPPTARKNNRQANLAKLPKAFSLEAYHKHTKQNNSDDEDEDKTPFNTTIIAGGTAAGVLAIAAAAVIVAVVKRQRRPMRPAGGVRPGVQKLRSIAAQFS